ncbi:ubiquinone biosynthesis hydrox, partial [Obba rivulosa]
MHLSTTLRVRVRKPSFHLAARASRSLSTAVQHEESDILIVGGGPAGLALASALGSSRVVRDALKVTLVEAGDLDKVRGWSMQQGRFSNRVSSITSASQAFLRDIGAWNHVDVERTCPIEEMQVWDGISDARVTFSTADIPSHTGVVQEEMARLTENLNLQRALLRNLASSTSIRLLDKVQVQLISREETEGGGWPLVHLSDGRILRTRLLVGADGPNSPVRAFAGIQSYGWAYDTHAVVATLDHAPRSPFEPPNTTAYQRFLPTGPIAFLPLSATVSSLVWSTTPALARRLVSAEPAALADMVNAAFRLPEVSMRYLHGRLLEADTPVSQAALREEIAFRERAHAIDPRSAFAVTAGATQGVPPADADAVPPLVTSVQEGTVASFPLRYNHADAYIGEGAGARTVLVGDAAHTVHPLAGQGLNMGLADVEALARCIHEAVLRGGDIGSYTALLPYARERYLENHKIMSAIDKLHKLYSAQAAPVVWARTVGVEVLNELDTLKAAMMMMAGSGRYSTQSAQTVGWNLAASGIENVARGLSAARSVADALAGVAGTGVQRLLRQVANARRP